ncbi:MAG: hypothetical protein KKC14_08180 [Alphaproteobacteria bacterium]|nr:hypothetical protein [Alphaproteobacteria bacterium]
MAKLSVTGAATAGLGLIARKPWAVVCWALVFLVLLLGPVLALVIQMAPALIDFIHTAKMQAQAGDEMSPALMHRMMGLQSGLMGLQLMSWFWSAGVKAVICAAVFRAVLHPGQDAFGYLRLGAQELWLALLFLVEAVLAMIVVVLAALLTGLVAALLFVIASKVGGGGGLAIKVVGCVAVLALPVSLIWVALRLSMAAPMTFADKTFRLFESWSLTRGKAWSLLGIAVLTVIFVILIEMLVEGVSFGALFLLGAPHMAKADPEQVMALLEQPPMVLLHRFWPWVAGLGVIWSMMAAIIVTVFCAPWAAAYKALTSEA